MILITGGTGLLGGHVLFSLLQKQERVAALVRPGARMDTLREIFSFYTDDPDSLMDRIEWRTGDMLDERSLLQALDGVSCVINCAAVVSFNPRERRRLVANNVVGAKNLAAALLQKQKDKVPDCKENPEVLLIHVSSTSALGDGPGNDPKFLIDEDTPRNPDRRHTGYSVSKFESERLLREKWSRIVILNPGIILGPGQWEKGSSQLFGKAWEGLRYYPYGGTGYVDVRDIASIINEIIQRAEDPHVTCSLQPLIGERFCLVAENLRYREFFNRVTDEYGKPNPHIYAGKILSGLAWRADTLRAGLSGTNPVLTRETAESAQLISFYTAAKIRQAIHFNFRSMDETVEWVAGCLMKKKSPSE